ncbi:MAG: pantetheine-phosphate adenylyltransferase [Clostridiales bacterium]|nr:pantetheine-phosphate adenylyltransferase [Clostridiales bacterium]
MKIGICPGSFDPITYGHIDIIERAANICDKVIVSVLDNDSKKALFSLEERVRLIKEVVKEFDNVEVESFNSLLIDYAREREALVIIKGLRAVSDFEYEFQMALMNRKLCPEIETIFLTTNNRYSYLSSSLVKEIAKFGGCIDKLVPMAINEAVSKRIKESSIKS